jgi:hypothetical protein
MPLEIYAYFFVHYLEEYVHSIHQNKVTLTIQGITE